MISFLPELHEGELLVGTLARYAKIIGCSNIKQLSRMAPIDSPEARIDKRYRQYVLKIAEEYGKLGYSFEQIVRDHSLHYNDRLLTNFADRYRSFNPDFGESLDYFQYCPECFHEYCNLGTVGIIKREHQHPLVSVCTEHGRFLKSVTKDRNDYLLPIDRFSLNYNDTPVIPDLLYNFASLYGKSFSIIDDTIIDFERIDAALRRILTSWLKKYERLPDELLEKIDALSILRDRRSLTFKGFDKVSNKEVFGFWEYDGVFNTDIGEVLLVSLVFGLGLHELRALDQSNPLVQLPLITEYNENNFSVELEYEVVLDKYPRWRFERASPCYENTCRIIVPLTQASVRNESMDVITSLYRKGNREKQTYKFKTIHGEGRKQSNIKGLGCFAFSEFVYLIITIPLGRTVE
ncbi:MAG: TniQ family protein [Neptuniibacter sp.]